MFLLCFVLFYCIPTHLHAVYVKKLGFGIWDKNEFYSFFSTLFHGVSVWYNTKWFIFPQGNAIFASSSFVNHNHKVLRCIMAHGVFDISFKKMRRVPCKKSLFLKKIERIIQCFLIKNQRFFHFFNPKSESWKNGKKFEVSRIS